MIQPGNRNKRCALLVAGALGISGTALAQAPTPAPAPATDPAAGDQPANPPLPPAPGPPPVPAQPVTTTPLPQPATPTFPTMAGPALKLSELFTFRPGLMLQLWGTLAQDAFKQTNGDSGAFAKNIYLRRARFFVGGSIGKDVTYFLLWETSNLGLPTVDATGAVSKGFTTFNFNDAFLDYKINPNFSVQAGLMVLPFARNVLQSTATYWSIDIGGVSASYIAATQTSTLRDTGVQLKINAVDNHFEARGMVSQGIRLADATASSAGTPLPATARNPGKNDPRVTGFVQYNFLDPDTGYVFNGQYFGRKKIVALAAGADYQSVADNPYFANSLAAFAAIPVHGTDAKNGGDEIGGQVEYLHFHGGNKSSSASALGKQDDLFVELGYYNKAAHLSVFGKFEGRFYASDSLTANDSRLYAGGIKYFLAEQLCNLTLQYSITQFPKIPAPTDALRNSVNAIQAQLQLLYF